MCQSRMITQDVKLRQISEYRFAFQGRLVILRYLGIGETLNLVDRSILGIIYWGILYPKSRCWLSGGYTIVTKVESEHAAIFWHL